MIEHKVVRGIEKMYITNGEKNIEVSLTWGDIDVLKNYAKEVKRPNTCVLLGTGQGGSALVVREVVDKNVDIYTIDEKSGFYKLYNRKDINFISGDYINLEKNWNKPIGLLLIDTEIDLSKEQFLAWEKHLVENAIVLFHDYGFHAPTVVAGCNSLFKDNKNYKVLFVPDSSQERNGITSMYQVRKLGN